MIPIARFSCSLSLLSLLSGCHRETDPDAELRTRYVKGQIERSDAGARFSLYNSDEVIFDDGWYLPAWYVPPFSKAGSFARPMREHALLRLRSHGNQSMHLVLEGAPQIEHEKGPVWLTVTLNGKRLAFFPIHGQLRADLDVPAAMLAKKQWVDVSIQASYVTYAPGDGRLISYRLTSISWEPTKP